MIKKKKKKWKMNERRVSFENWVLNGTFKKSHSQGIRYMTRDQNIWNRRLWMRKARDLVKSVPRSFSTARTPTPAQMDPSDRYCYNPVLRWNPQVEAYFSKAYGPHHFSRITQALAYYPFSSFYSSLSVFVLSLSPHFPLCWVSHKV